MLVHGRTFSPRIGIKEDPVTGNSNGPLGAYLVHFRVCPQLESEDAFEFDILYGEAIGRTGGMHVHVKIENGRPVQVKIIGEAVAVYRCEIEL